MEGRTYEYVFLFTRLHQHHAIERRSYFVKRSYYLLISIVGQKTLHRQLNKVIPFDMNKWEKICRNGK